MVLESAIQSGLMGNLFTNPPRLPLIAPSILSADFGHMADECRGVLEGGADLLHVDVMDGHFVPNLTMGPDMVAGVRRALPDAFLDVHLMVTDPGLIAEPFIKAGADHITFHVEVLEADGIKALIDRIRSLGATAGLAINPPTPVEQIMPYIELVDMALVMSVNPGYSGQAFIESVLEKTRTISQALGPDQRLEMDGGISAKTTEAVQAAGCDVLVGGSAMFGVNPEQRPGAMAEIREPKAL